MDEPDRRARRQLAIFLGAAIAAALFLLHWGPISARIPHLLSAPAHLGIHVCPWRGITGIPCPGCGGTRALLELSNADLPAALAMNPAVSLAAVGAMLLAVVAAIAPAAGDRLLALAGTALRTRRGRVGVAVLLAVPPLRHALTLYLG
jgi:hypothetical protein